MKPELTYVSYSKWYFSIAGVRTVLHPRAHTYKSAPGLVKCTFIFFDTNWTRKMLCSILRASRRSFSKFARLLSEENLWAREQSQEPSHCINSKDFGVWENRIEEPILLQQSIKHGIPIPKISLEMVGYASSDGRKSVNEDRIRIHELQPNLLYFGIFDGHGGTLAADYTHNNLEHHIAYWLSREPDLQVVLRNAYIDLNNKFMRHLILESENPSSNSGTTATVGLLRNGNELVLSHVGDTRLTLCRKGKAIRLSKDHEPEVPEEQQRIKASGGFISCDSIGRPLVNGILTMSRSIGDTPLKRYGVTAVPQTKSVEIKHSKDSFLIFTTDGVHFVMTDQEICDAINQVDDPREAAHFIVDQAMQFGSDDNASAMVVPLGQWGNQEYCNPNFQYSLRWRGRSNC
ncbi:protein phosphatase 1K, mitochondrial-like [Anneissia japonica]|uniref:protein phosphatase 1K, mitochondrial-like n=1 Tax=Anneissia japonica TaxID=1529436 RepID=UPI0014257951|nr:protein phosphatase 1K, mitochondrial-like [Anneissia japonica]